MTHPKHLSIAADPSGEIWIVEARYRQPLRRVKQVTNDVLLALCADVMAVDNTKLVEREVRFADGARARITVEVVEDSLGGRDGVERPGCGHSGQGYGP